MKAERIDLSEDLLRRILARLQAHFYAGQEKLFWQEKRMLEMAISTPARYLEDRDLGLPAEGLEKMVLEVIRGIVEHADVPKIHSFGRYFLKAMQEHMKHQGERYLQSAKAVQKTTDHVMLGLEKLTGGVLEIDVTSRSLAAVNQALSERSGRKKKQVAGEQIDLPLTGSAKPPN